MPSTSDRSVLQHAVTTRQWILTFDRDYGELIFTHLAPPPPAVLYLRQAPLTMQAYAERVMALTATPAEVIGHMVVVEEKRVRLRRLPDILHTDGPEGPDPGRFS